MKTLGTTHTFLDEFMFIESIYCSYLLIKLKGIIIELLNNFQKFMQV